MNAEEWEEAKNLFVLTLTEPVENRAVFLEAACSSEEIRKEVLRLLEQHDRAGKFLSEPAWVESSLHTAQGLGESVQFSGTPRFIVEERLGEGTFGIVYRVFDRERNAAVALKTLRRLDAPQLTRFKQEFRLLVDLVHPNLIQLYELFGHEQMWFFTMELVEGTDFLSYTRPNDAVHSWSRLREALAQLASGVQALHAFGRLHRDLKPSNVLISDAGQLLILDFGLVKNLDGESVEQSVALAGSPAYMAPEQIGGGPITAAVDWYAIGVMLYRAITGVFPFQGDWEEVLQRKRLEDAPNPKTANPEVPDDLNGICQDLLKRTPDLRPDGPGIHKRLQRMSEPTPAKARNEFVGRRAELDTLAARFRELDAGGHQVVVLQGSSGIGKTTLVNEFLNRVVAAQPNAVILRGRCRESESVPFKALDSVADQIVRYLRGLPKTGVAALLPRYPAFLRRMFPCFSELEILAELPDRTDQTLDDQEIRFRAFAAVCETLERIADRQPVIISIDDLQWGDLDSIAMLAELIVPVDAPRLMLILTFRSEDAESSPPVRLLRIFQARLTEKRCWTEISLAGLGEEDGRDLLRRLDQNGAVPEEQVRGMAEESRGSPLYLRELLRARMHDGGPKEIGGSVERVSVADMIRHRVQALSPVARQLFEALCVSIEPLSRTILYRTVAAPHAVLAREVSHLIDESLVRVTGGSEAGGLEVFHDQAREGLLSAMIPSDLKNWHSRLAKAFEAEGAADPAKLLRHYLGAGDMPSAYRSALAGARIAETALAFDRAAGFYSEAIQTGEADSMTLAMLYRRRAEAYAKAGRGLQAAADYLTAERWPEHNDAFQMRRLSAEQLMRSGHLDEGFAAFTRLLRSVGFWMPSTPLQSIVAMIAIRLLIRLRGMKWQQRRGGDLVTGTIRKLDLLWSGASIFFVVNPVFGTYLQARHMLGALRAGEPLRLALSIGLGASYECLGGAPYYHLGRKLLNLAERIALPCEDAHVSAWITVDWVFLDFLCGRIGEGLTHSRKAVRELRELGSDQSWEGSTAKLGLTWFLGWSGKIQEMTALVPSVLNEARSRGDVYTFVVIRCCAMSHLADLAADDPDRALEEIKKALSEWSQTRYDAPRLCAVYAAVECELYAGRIDAARARVLSEWPMMKRSLLARKCQFFQVMLSYMRARTAFASWIFKRDQVALMRETRSFISRLQGARSPLGTALSELLVAAIAATEGRVPQAMDLLAGAEAMLSENGYRLLAIAASRRRGELEGKAGISRIEAADKFMRSESILRPDRMTAMFLPGEWNGG
jgi:hypothetical protein